MTDSTAVARCCERIRTRARDPRLLLVPGLADDLRLIGEAFASIEAGQGAIARVVLAKHYGYNPLPPDYHHLVELAREPEESSPCRNETKR